MQKLKELLKSFLALLFGIVISLILAEIILRIYNPIPFRVKGNQIVLPINQTVTIDNTTLPGLDTLIIHKKNSMGFRGAEKPADFEKYTSIIVVGGSTTECYYHSDGKDWVTLFGSKLSKQHKNIWINNAGIDGQSTFGHTILLDDYISKIHPKYLMFLVGCNDIGRDDLGEYDDNVLKGPQTFQNWLITNCEVISLAVNLNRGLKSKRRHLEHQRFDLNAQEHIPYDSVAANKEIEKHSKLLSQYHSRLSNLVKKTKQYGITPILITQPTLVGEGIDSVTGQNLETIKLMIEYQGKTYWRLLEEYNNVTRMVAQEENIHVVDLARKMPKNSVNFYDLIHFTNKGSEMVSEILYQDMKNYIH